MENKVLSSVKAINNNKVIDEFDDDILRPLLKDELSLFIKELEKNLPQSLRAFNYLSMQNKWLEKLHNPENIKLKENFCSHKLNCNFFTHKNGKLENTTFFSISGEDDYCIFIYTEEKNCNELKECLEKTQHIKWNIGPLIVSLEERHRQAVMNHINKVKSVIDWEIPNKIYYLPKELGSQLEIEIPENVYISNIREEDSKLINSEWPHSGPGSYEFLHCTVLINGGFGIFSKETNELLSWVLINENYCAGSLQTLNEHKRNGYGKILVKYLVKHLAVDQNVEGLSFIIIGNKPSESLFHSVGFKAIANCSWILLKKS